MRSGLWGTPVPLYVPSAGQHRLLRREKSALLWAPTPTRRSRSKGTPVLREQCPHDAGRRLPIRPS